MDCAEMFRTGDEMTFRHAPRGNLLCAMWKHHPCDGGGVYRNDSTSAHFRRAEGAI